MTVSELGDTIALDPLNDVLLPAHDLAKRIEARSASRGGEMLLASAVLLLMAERTSYRLLLRREQAVAKHAQEYADELRREVTPEALTRIGNIQKAKHRPYAKSARQLP